MNAYTRRKLSIAFTIYNQAIADARRSGDIKKIAIWNQVLGRMIKDAYRSNRSFNPAR